MAIRIKREVWALIRSEYEAGATAAELVARYKGVKYTTIHARAGREKWRDIPIPPNKELGRYAAGRARVEGISIEAAIELEMIDQARLIAEHRAEIASLGGIIMKSMHLASDASQKNNVQMAKFAAALSSAARDAAVALSLKIRTARIAYGLDSNHLPSTTAVFAGIYGMGGTCHGNASKFKSEAL
jgi:hypothetical protein